MFVALHVLVQLLSNLSLLLIYVLITWGVHLSEQWNKLMAPFVHRVYVNISTRIVNRNSKYEKHVSLSSIWFYRFKSIEHRNDRNNPPTYPFIHPSMHSRTNIEISIFILFFLFSLFRQLSSSYDIDYLFCAPGETVINLGNLNKISRMTWFIIRWRPANSRFIWTPSACIQWHGLKKQ